MATSMLDGVFAALSDPTRRAIVERLVTCGEATAGALAEPFEMSKPAISRHLKVLEDAGLIERRVDAQWRIFRARPEALADASGWVDKYRAFWERALDRLGAELEKPSTDEGDDS